MELPDDVYVQAQQMFEEHCERQKELEEHYRSNRKGPLPPSRVQVGPKPTSGPAQESQTVQQEPAGVDSRTGRELVTTRRPDGTVVRHRRIEDGELFLWKLTGKVPKSWQGKIDL